MKQERRRFVDVKQGVTVAAMSEQMIYQGRLSALVPPFSALLGSSIDAASLYASDGRLVAQNDAAVGLRQSVRLDDLRSGTLAREALAKAIGGERACYEAQVRSSEGPLQLHIDISPVQLDGEICGVLEIAREPRVRLTADEQSDQITGFPSATVLYDRISRLLNQFRRDNKAFALHLFAVGADSLEDEGFVAELHRVTAARLSATLRRVDTVARLGRAFVVLQPEVTDELGTKRLIERLIDELREPIAWHGRIRVPQVRVGTAISSRHTNSVEELIVEADLALARVRTGTRESASDTE